MPSIKSTSDISAVVVGYDGSKGAEAAAGFALWLTRTTGCETTLVHVTVSPGVASTADVLIAATDHLATDRKEWKRRLDHLREYAPPDAQVTTRVIAGSPADALIEIAHETAANLVLVGSHGVGRVRGMLFGSVSSQLLSRAPCSVMIFREDAAAPPAKRLRSVVACVDGSPASLGAVAQAGSIARAVGAQLVLVYARAPTDRQEADAALAEARSRSGFAEEHIEVELVDGDPLDSLIAASGRYAPALLVVGSHGGGGIRRLFGSTPWAVASHAPCPVVIFHASPTTRSAPEVHSFRPRSFSTPDNRGS